MINIVYMLMGVIVGILLKYEIDLKAKKKRLEKRSTYLKATAEHSTLQQYDEILVGLRGLNDSLKTQHKKEVR
jgi:hypothetical protein